MTLQELIDALQELPEELRTKEVTILDGWADDYLLSIQIGDGGNLMDYIENKGLEKSSESSIWRGLLLQYYPAMADYLEEEV